MTEDAAKPHQHAEGGSAELALAPGIRVTVSMEPAKGEHGGEGNNEGHGEGHGYREGDRHTSMVARTMLAAGRSVAWLNARALGARELGFESRRPDLVLRT